MDLIGDAVFGNNDGVSDLCYDQGYGNNLDFLDQPNYGGQPSYESKHDSVSYGNGQINNLLSYGQPHAQTEVHLYNDHQLKGNHQVEEVAPDPEPVQRMEDNPHYLQSKPKITISNVVSNFRCRCHLNLRTIAQATKHVIYKRDQGKIMMKMRDPGMMANIWSSGKIVCQGAKSEYDAKRGSRTFARIIQKSGFPNVRISNYKVVNVLGNCRVPFALDIMQFSTENAGHNLSYEPELHPAVTFKPGNGATLKIFSTGALTILGRNVETVQEALDISYPLIYPYRRDSSQGDAEDYNSDIEEY